MPYSSVSQPTAYHSSASDYNCYASLISLLRINLAGLPPTIIHGSTFLYTLAGFTAGLLTNWFLQKFVYRYITKDQQRSKLVFLKFVVLSLIGFGITWVGMQLSTPLHDDVLIDFLFLHNIQLIFWIFKVVLTIIVLIINYVGRKLFVFNQKDEISNIESNHEIDKELEKEKSNN